MNENCAELGISYRRFGDVIFYSAGTMLSAMPTMTKETDPKRRPGGHRTKSTKNTKKE